MDKRKDRIKDYSNKTEIQLTLMIKELKMRIMQSYGHIEKKEKKESRKNLKKEIARIKTELKSRKNK